ncbi:hypothetical protein QR680_014487 [Steinernema hermaphroditum]|uniref:Uncharacterized protein n=1 Tax=Steinernema hermaphroditum TaxID=289476 RepID=A0AA39I909_9BILA|nr:hypothetical protein QR680_014487 [Steinernema hermaphroditum]
MITEGAAITEIDGTSLSWAWWEGPVQSGFVLWSFLTLLFVLPLLSFALFISAYWKSVRRSTWKMLHFVAFVGLCFVDITTGYKAVFDIDQYRKIDLIFKVFQVVAYYLVSMLIFVKYITPKDEQKDPSSATLLIPFTVNFTVNCTLPCVISRARFPQFIQTQKVDKRMQNKRCCPVAKEKR